jgi:hypothetical protein
MANKIRSGFVLVVAVLMRTVWFGGTSTLDAAVLTQAIGGGGVRIVNTQVPGGPPIPVTTASLAAHLFGGQDQQLIHDVSNLLIWDILGRPAAFGPGPDTRLNIVGALTRGGGGTIGGLILPEMGVIGAISILIIGVPDVLAVNFNVLPGGQVTSTVLAPPALPGGNNRNLPRHGTPPAPLSPPLPTTGKN